MRTKTREALKDKARTVVDVWLAVMLIRIAVGGSVDRGQAAAYLAFVLLVEVEIVLWYVGSAMWRARSAA